MTRSPNPAVGPSAPRALWGIVRFFGRRPGWVALSIGLLLVNISIELYLPQIPGNAITALGNARDAASVSLVALALGVRRRTRRGVRAARR